MSEGFDRRGWRNEAAEERDRAREPAHDASPPPIRERKKLGLRYGSGR